MEGKIAQELEGKNLKRVLPQVKRTIKLQRQRTTGYCVSSVILAFLGLGGFFVAYIPSWLQYVSLFLLPFLILGIFGDYKLYKYQKAKAQYIEHELSK
jgi:hypothetical protein